MSGKIAHRIEHLLGYVTGLVAALVDDYTLITLLIFVTLLGFLVSSVLIAATAFFGLYFLLRLVSHVAEGIGFTANSIGGATNRQAQATMQVAAALAQFHPPQDQELPQGVYDPNRDTLP